jgi:hypothetical protein
MSVTPSSVASPPAHDFRIARGRRIEERQQCNAFSRGTHLPCHFERHDTAVTMAPQSVWPVRLDAPYGLGEMSGGLLDGIHATLTGCSRIAEHVERLLLP